jgi:hypothetical protein
MFVSNNVCYVVSLPMNRHCSVVPTSNFIFSVTEKIKFEVGTAEQCLFIGRALGKTGNVVTYIVGYVDDLIVPDRSNQNHVSKQILEYIQKYWKVSDEGTLTHYLGVLFTKDVNGGWTVDNSPYITQTIEKFESFIIRSIHTTDIATDTNVYRLASSV